MSRTTVTAGGPGFIVDHNFLSRSSGRQVDWTKVPENRRRTVGQVVKLNGAALAAATSLTVDALAGPIASGTILDFTGTNKFAQLTAAAVAGATTLTVAALPQALADNDEAIVAGSGNKYLPAGTVVSESVSSNVRKVIPRVDGTGAGTSFGVLTTDAEENAKQDALSGYGVLRQAPVYENLLPDAVGSPRVLDSTIKAELVALGFKFETYSDSAAT